MKNVIREGKHCDRKNCILLCPKKKETNFRYGWKTVYEEINNENRYWFMSNIMSEDNFCCLAIVSNLIWNLFYFSKSLDSAINIELRQNSN